MPDDIDKKTWSTMVNYTKSFLYLIGSIILISIMLWIFF
jgi:hypothetical protein